MSYTPRGLNQYISEISLTPSTTNYISSTCEIASTPIKTSTLTWEQFVLLNAEIDRLSNLNKTLTTENDGLRLAQRNYIQEIDSLKCSLAHSRESDNKHSIICQERDRLNSILTERLREIDLLRSRVAELEGNEAKCGSDLRQKLTLLAADNQRLNCVVSDRKNEIEDLKCRIHDWEDKYSHTCQDKDRIITERLREIDLLRLRITELEGINTEFKGKLALLASENDRLGCALVDKRTEIDGLKHKLAHVHELEDKYNAVLYVRDQLNHAITERNKELNALRVKYTDTENILCQNEEMKSKLAIIATENQRLSCTLADRLRETDVLRAKIVELEKNLGQFNELKARTSQLITENERLSCLLVERTKEIDGLKHKIAHNNDFEHKYCLALQERDRMNSILAERLKEIDVLRARVAEIERNCHQSDELRGKLALLASENDRLNHQLNEKTIIIREWETKYSTLEALYSKVKISVDSLEEVKKSLVQSIEHTERREPSLRNSEVAKKTSRYYISSDDTNTNAGSPLKSRSPIMKSGFNSSLNSSYYV